MPSAPSSRSPVPNAEYGTVFTQGVQLAMQHIAADNLLRRPLRLQAEDTQALPQQGVIGMQKLINVDRVACTMVGFTAVAKAVAPIGDRAKSVMINGGAVGPDLAGLSPYFWNVIPLAHLETRALLPYLNQQRQVRRVALVYVDDPLGDAILGELRAQLPRNGAELVGTFSIPRTAQQFQPIAARVRQARPDAVYIASFGAQQAQIVKGLRDNGVTQILCSYSAMNLDSIKTLPEAEGLVFTGQKMDFEGGDELTRSASPPISTPASAGCRPSTTPTTTTRRGSSPCWRAASSRPAGPWMATACGPPCWPAGPSRWSAARANSTSRAA